jgi:hypothetical protein
VVFVSLKGCSNVTGAAVQALVEHCTGIQTIYLNGCSNITDVAVQALAEHCTGIQYIDLTGCSNITDAAVQALAEHCTGIQIIGLGGCSSVSEEHRCELDAAAIDSTRRGKQDVVINIDDENSPAGTRLDEAQKGLVLARAKTQRAKTVV